MNNEPEILAILKTLLEQNKQLMNEVQELKTMMKNLGLNGPSLEENGIGRGKSSNSSLNSNIL